MSDTPNITESDTPAEPELPAEHPGVEDGEVITTTVPAEEAGGEVTEVAEKIVHETDADGNVTGWHKEPADG